MKRWILLLTGLFTLLYAVAATAQEMPPMRSKAVAGTWPRLTIGGRGIVTFNYDYKNKLEDEEDGEKIDFADTSLFFQIDEELYSKVHGGFIIGFKFPDKDVELEDWEPVFFSQVNAFLDAERWGVTLGRTRLHNKMITFPTIRDDDQLTYTWILNGMVNNDASELHQFGSQLIGDAYFRDSALRFSAYTGNMFVTDEAGDEVLNEFDLNAFGFDAVYDIPIGLRYEQYLRTVGLTYFTQKVDTEEEDWMHSIILGSVVNLNKNPLYHWDARAQLIYNNGADRESVESIQDRALSEYVSAAAAVRYLHQPYQIPFMQAALTVAYKDFSDVDAAKMSIIPSFVYRLGNNFDLLAQYEYEKNFDKLEDVTGIEDEHTVWVGLAFNYNVMFNDYIGERRELVNVLHDYIP